MESNELQIALDKELKRIEQILRKFTEMAEDQFEVESLNPQEINRVRAIRHKLEEAMRTAEDEDHC